MDSDADNTTPATPAGGGRGFGRDLTVGSIPWHLIRFSLPMLLGSLFQTAYSFINAIWVGKYLGGDVPLAAVTVSFPVVFVLFAVGAGLTMATNILVSQNYGARDMAAVGRVVNSSSILILVVGLVVLALGEWLTPWILAAMGTPPDVLAAASDYLRIFLLSLPLMYMMFLTRNMLQGIGDSKTPLYFLAGSVVLNIGLDPVLMFGWLGAPKLGLNGTAWASVISQVLGLWALVSLLHKRRNPVAPRLGWGRFDWSTAWATIRIGTPTALQQSLISVGMVFVTGIVNGFGSEAMAAFGAGSRVDQLAFMPALTFSMAIATLAGQNIGAGLHHRVREIFWWGCALSGGITIAMSALVVALPRVAVRIFTDEPAVIDMGAEYLSIVGLSYTCFAIMFVANGIINGSGHTLVTTAISLLSLWIVRVPAAVWLSGKLGIRGVWYAMAISFGVSMMASLAYYASGRWRRPISRGARPANAVAAFGEETGEG